jgi:hypothetical protein
MKTIEFPEHNKVYAKDQKEYNPLPVHDRHNYAGEQVSCWELTWKERFKVLFSGKIWLSMWTFGKPLQPVRITVDKEDLIFNAPLNIGDYVVQSGVYTDTVCVLGNDVVKVVDVYKVPHPAKYAVKVMDKCGDYHDVYIDAVKLHQRGVKNN